MDRVLAGRSNHVSRFPSIEKLELRRLLSAGVFSETNAIIAKQSVLAASAKAPKKPARPDLQAGSDDGARNNDDVTSVSRPIFDIEKVDANMTVQLLRNGVVVASVFTSTGGTVALQDAGLLAAGTYQYTARMVNPNGVAGGESAALKVTITAAPAPPPAPAAVDLDAASDTGSSDADNLTAAAALSFTVAGVESGMTVRLLRDGAVVASGVASSTTIALVDSSATADGSYSYTAVAVNSAGLSSAASPSLAVLVDRTPPAASAPDLAAAYDSGYSASDNITWERSLSFELTAVEDGAVVEMLRDGVVVATSVGSGGAMALADPATLADGAYGYSTRMTDSAGNVATSATLVVTVDTVSPGATSAPVLSDASDLGIKGDNITRDRLPMFVVSGCEPFALVELIEDGEVVASAVASEDGTVTLGPTSRLMPGVHTIAAQQRDAAGNVSGISGETSFKIVNAVASSDFDGDGISDVAIYTGGMWTIELSSGGTRTEFLGGASDVPIPGDYDGDGVTDIAMYRPSGRSIRVIPSSDPDTITVQFIGTAFQLPVPADYDGDGKTDAAVYNHSTGVFTIMNSTGGTTTVTMPTGALPAVADYDGDGKADIAVYDPASGDWTIMQSTGLTLTRHFGAGDGSDQPLPGDYDGDGFDDLAVYSAATGELKVFAGSAGELMTALPPGEIPVVADFDGDNRFDPATYAQATAMWSIFRSSAGAITMSQGEAGAANQPLPLSAELVRRDVLGF